MTSLPEHIATFLGRGEDAWPVEADPHGLQVVRTSNQPMHGVAAYATLGLSNTVLRLPGSRTIRQELVFAA